MKKLPLLLALVVAVPAFAGGAYNRNAGQNAPAAAVERKEVKDDSGKVKWVDEVVDGPVKRDAYGNAQGNQYDLAVDGAFDGQTVAVLQFYNFEMTAPQAALKEKGFSMFRWLNNPPPAKELEAQLKKANQLWVISDCNLTPHLSADHVAVIKKYFEAGNGVYIWGDNDPCYGDANLLGQALLGVTMSGDLPGDHPVTVQRDNKGPGMIKNHLISTGVETVYEGVTIATIDNNQTLTPLLYGSAGNLVAAAYDHDGKRLIFDGGFTRLYYKWDTAGTARYVKNAAAWLANVEKKGDSIVASEVKR